MKEQRHGAAFNGSSNGVAYSPDAVAGALSRGDGGFGRDQSTYFDSPILRKAHWRWEIEWYFFVGGLAAGSLALSTLAEQAGDPADASLVRNGRYAALVGAGISGVLLVKDLGRPERFLNMLRIAKLKSPMSVGVYALSGFSTAAGIAALRQARADGLVPLDPLGWFPGSARRSVAAITSGLMASYTGVLLSATAIPVWYTGRRHIPAIFVLSAASTAAALQNLLNVATNGSPRTSKKLEAIEFVASLAEAAMVLDWKRRAGDAAAPLFGGARGRRLETWTLLLGIAVPALIALPSLLARTPPKKLHPVRTVLAASLALAGGYVLRKSVVEAGRDSADDPRAYLQHPS